MWKSKNKKAIDILIRQRDRVDTKNHNNNDTWVFQTASYIIEYFGEYSPEEKYIAEFQFENSGSNPNPSEQWKQGRDYKEGKMIQFMDNCIETIKDKGILKKSKKTLIGNLSLKEVWLIGGGIIALAVLAFGAGVKYEKWSVFISANSISKDQPEKTTNDTHGKNQNR